MNSRPRSYHRYSPIPRATASRALKDGFAVHAILPRPEGRGLPRYQIKALPLKQSKDELRESLLIGTASELIDRLKAYEELGVDELIMNGNIGHDNQESLDALERFAADVMPCFSAAKPRSPIMQATGT